MLFVDFLGPANTYLAVRAAVQERVAAVFRAPVQTVVVRRRPVESDYAGVEVWIELSSEEQLRRYGQRLAADVSEAIRASRAIDVWVLFHLVPLDRAFLNGVPRQRHTPSLE